MTRFVKTKEADDNGEWDAVVDKVTGIKSRVLTKPSAEYVAKLNADKQKETADKQLETTNKQTIKDQINAIKTIEDAKAIMLLVSEKIGLID